MQVENRELLYYSFNACCKKNYQSFWLTLHPSLSPYLQTELQRNELILVGLGNLQFLQVNTLHSHHNPLSLQINESNTENAVQ